MSGQGQVGTWDTATQQQWDALTGRMEKAERELASSVEHANEGWNGKLDAERERDEARATIERIEALVERMRAKGQKNVASYWFRMADELEAVLK